ncbi:Uncharacterized protein APZ42_025133, partial [Daphnia magna]
MLFQLSERAVQEALLEKEVSLLREIPDPSQFQSDSEPQGEEFGDIQSYQDSRNLEAGSAVTEGAYELVAARKQYEGAREVGNEGGVNARTGAGNEKRQEMRVIDRDQGLLTRQAEFDDHESLIPQVSVSSVQEKIHEQRRKSYNPNSLDTQWSVTGNREVRQGSARVKGAAGRKRTDSVEADTTGVINHSSGTDSGQPSEARGDEDRGVERKSPCEAYGLEHLVLRRKRQRGRHGGTPNVPLQGAGKVQGTPKENAIEWIDQLKRIGRHNHWSNNDLARAIDVSLEGAAYKWIVGLEARNAHPENWEDLTVQVAETDDEAAHYREVRGLKTLFLKQFLAVNLKWQTERKLHMRVLGKEGLSPALYERLYVLGIKSFEEFLEEARLHVDAVKTSCERGYEDARRKREKPVVGAVDLDKVQDLQCQIQELRDELARAGDLSKRPSKKLLQNSGLLAGYALIDCWKTDAVVQVMNVDYADHVIVEGTSIGHLVPIDQTTTFDQCVASTLAAQDRNDLIELLIEFQDVFADSGDCLGKGTVLEHATPKGGAAPIKQLPRRRAWKKRELIKDEVNKMLKQGVIEQSPWSSPIVLLKKKYDDALSKLEGAALFSVVDLQSGYWKVPVAEAYKPKTAFVTPDGLYQFRTDCLVYMDDVVIFGKDTKEHLERLGKVLSCFRKANLKLKMEKYAGIEPDPEHCKAIEMFPGSNLNSNEKTKRKWVKSFVCLYSFYRKFVPNFTQVAYPLTVMEDKGVFRWGELERNGFAELKAALDKANARLASVKSRKKRDIQRNVRDYNLLLLEDESEEEIYTEIAYIVLNAGGFDRDTEVELDTAVMETDEMAENFEDNFSDIKDGNNGVQSSS